MIVNSIIAYIILCKVHLVIRIVSEISSERVCSVIKQSGREGLSVNILEYSLCKHM